MSKRTRRSSSMQGIFCRTVLSGMAVGLLFVGTYSYFTDVDPASIFDKFEKRVAQKQQDLRRASLPKNFDELPPYIKAMPVPAKDQDTDMNGLRDDVQVHIAYEYPYAPNLRAGLIQLSSAISKLTMVRRSDRIGDVANILYHYDVAMACIQELGFEQSSIEKLKDVIFNTYPRRTYFDKALKRRAEVPEQFNRPLPGNVCDNILLENEGTLQNWVPS